MHYKRWRNHGDPLGRQISLFLSDEELRALLIQRVDITTGSEACHPWTGALDATGYGVLSKRYNGSRLAHRAVLSLHLGRPIPANLGTRHACDNPPCCNIMHLAEGTQAQNMDDAWVRGRTRGGRYNQTECKWGHALTPDNVRFKRHKSTRRDFQERVCLKCRTRRNKEQAARRKAIRAMRRKEKSNNVE